MKSHNCGLYIRVSTTRQANVEDGSLDAQEANYGHTLITKRKTVPPLLPLGKQPKFTEKKEKAVKISIDQNFNA